jgi:hypothetical protein
MVQEDYMVFLDRVAAMKLRTMHECFNVHV